MSVVDADASRSQTSLWVNGRYQVELSQTSGMSTIYVGTDTRTNRAVVLKAVPTSDFELSSALVREREMLVRLDHPGIVRCLELFAESDRTFLALEHVPGHDLEAFLRLGDERRDERRVREWGIQLAEIVCYLHAQHPPIVFRDLKPSNIILRPDGRLVLVDFGAARVRTDAPKDTIQLGTPGYAAPEQYRAATDERTDIYALGVTLFELLSRRDPTAFGFVFPPLDEIGVNVSPAFAAVLQRALSPSLHDRFPSMQAMLAALKACRPGFAQAQRAVALLSVVAIGAAAALLNAAATSWTQRYVGGFMLFVAAILCGIVTTREDRSVTELDVPPWLRHKRTLSLLTVAVLLGLVPFTLPLSTLSGHLRRLSLELCSGAVPLEGAPIVFVGSTALLALLGVLIGRALQRRDAWIWPLTLAVFMGSMFSAHVVTDVRHDAGHVPTIRDAPLWMHDCGPATRPFSDMTLVYGDGDNKFYVAARTGASEFEMLDAATGHRLWRGTSLANAPLFFEPGCFLTVDGRTVKGHAIANGAPLFKYTAPMPVRFLTQTDPCLLVVMDSAIAALANDRLQSPISPAWTFRMPHAGAMVFPATADVVFIYDRDASRMFALDAATGKPLWDRRVDPRVGALPRVTRSGWMYVEGNLLQTIDVKSGRVVASTALPAASVNVDRLAPPRINPLDKQHVLVQRNNLINAVDLHDGKTLWSTRLPGERFSLHEIGAGPLCLSTRSGKLLGLDPLSGRVQWEWWGGGLGEHILPSTDAGFAFCEPFMMRLLVQERPGAPLSAIDPSAANGTVFWRHEMPEGFTVERVLTDGRMLYIAGRNAQQHMIAFVIDGPREIPMGPPRPR